MVDSSSKTNTGLLRGVLIGSLFGVVLGALATTLAGRAVLRLMIKFWSKLSRREEGVDFRWLLQ